MIVDSTQLAPAVESDSPLPVAAAALPRVNLLPPEIAERKALRRLQAGLAAGVAATAGLVGLLYLSAGSGLEAAESELAAAQAEQATLQRRVSALSHVSQARGRIENAKTTLVTVMGGEIRWSRYLNDLSLTLPDNVWVKSMTVTGNAAPATATAGAAAATPSPAPGSTSGSAAATPAASTAGPVATVTFTGYALSHDDVAVWLETLAKQKGYADPYFSDSKSEMIGDKRVVTFTSTVTVTADALSKRYHPVGG
jgi:Tfp pilus assembly protein PilN